MALMLARTLVASKTYDRGQALAVYKFRLNSDPFDCGATIGAGLRGLNQLLSDARRGLFDVVIVWRFDRFARSVKQLVMSLEEFRSLNIDFVSHQEALDTSTPMGRAMFTIIAAMAELERSVIRERVIAGLDYAHAHGTKSGKPVGRPRVICRRDEVVRLRDEEGYSWGRIKSTLGVSTGTARRIYLEAKRASGTLSLRCNVQAPSLSAKGTQLRVASVR